MNWYLLYHFGFDLVKKVVYPKLMLAEVSKIYRVKVSLRDLVFNPLTLIPLPHASRGGEGSGFFFNPLALTSITCCVRRRGKLVPFLALLPLPLSPAMRGCEGAGSFA